MFRISVFYEFESIKYNVLQGNVPNMINFRFHFVISLLANKFLVYAIDCPSNYVSNNGHCYGFIDQSLSWYNARDRCKQDGEGFDLVKIDDSGENQFLKDKIVSQYNGNQYWIGLKENTNGDNFDWVDGSSLSFSDWKGGEPNEVER